MTIVIIFVLGYIIGRLSLTRQHSEMALSAPAPMLSIMPPVAIEPDASVESTLEPEITTATPVVIAATPTKAAQEPQKCAETAQTERHDITPVKTDKARVAQEKARQAAIDLSHYTMQRERLMELSDVIETELTGNITEKRRAALMRQQITLEERLYQTEKKMNKAYFILNAA